MTEALALDAWRDAHDGELPKVLDVGTGSGYQAAVLAEMGARVVSVELEPSLAERAREMLQVPGLRGRRPSRRWQRRRSR